MHKLQAFTFHIQICNHITTEGVFFSSGFTLIVNITPHFRNMAIVIYFGGLKFLQTTVFLTRKKTDLCVDGDLQLQSPVSNMM